MMTKQELVRNHVLCDQSSVVAQLLKHGVISKDSLYGRWQEVMEWRLVTPFLAEQLENKNEIVLKKVGCCWWGRTCSGQAIYMDEVISKIVRSFNKYVMT